MVLGRQAQPQRGPLRLRLRQGRQPPPLAKGRCHNHDSFPYGGVVWFWLTTANVPHGGVRWSMHSERNRNAARFARERGKGDNRRLAPASSAPTVVSPLTVTAQPSSAATATLTAQPLAASTVTAPGTQSGPSYIPQGSGTPWGPWFPQPIMGRIPCPTQEQQPLAPRTSHRGRALNGGRGSPILLWAESPAPHRNSSPWPLVHPTGVGHSLGAVVPPTFYGRNPLPHTGTAALASLAAAAVLPTAASHPGPGSGSSGQDALLVRVDSSASLFWGAPQALSTQVRPQAPLLACLHSSSPLCSRGHLWRGWIPT